MKAAVLSTITAVLVLICGCATAHRSGREALQGTWRGQEAGGAAEGVCSLVVNGKALEFRGADSREWYKGTFTLKEDTNPKQLIGIIKECPEPAYIGKTVNAIYQIEAGTLTLTGNEPGNPERPASFDAPGSRKFVLRKS